MAWLSDWFEFDILLNEERLECKMLVSLCCILFSVSVFSPTSLKYIKLPKAPVYDRDRMLSAHKRMWSEYDRLYEKFSKIAASIEYSYDNSGKNPHDLEEIKRMNNLANHSGWKNMASLKPFNFKLGLSEIEKRLCAIEFENTKVEYIVPVGSFNQESVGRTPRETMYQGNIKSQEEISSQWAKMPKGTAANKKKRELLWKAEMQSRIINEAKANGEVWAVDK